MAAPTLLDFSPAQGIHGQGGRAYRISETIRVLHVLELTSRLSPLTVEQIAHRTALGGRTIRQIIHDLDGNVFLLGGGDDGFFVCRYAEEAEGLTRRLSSQVRSMRGRLERRVGFADRLKRLQLPLWMD